jgi:ketosteroid isomerase-like protein
VTGSSPQEVVHGFGAALSAGDPEGATAMFSGQGCFVTPDSTVIEGRAEVRGFLQQFVALASELSIDQRTMLTAGDIAVGSESWSVRLGRGPGAVRRISRSTIVLGRIEGVWRIAVVDPWRA